MGTGNRSTTVDFFRREGGMLVVECLEARAGCLNCTEHARQRGSPCDLNDNETNLAQSILGLIPVRPFRERDSTPV